jgi:hypothetical protein
MPKQLVNNAIAGLDVEFLAVLQGSNHGTGFFDPGWVIVAKDGDRVQIEKDGLHLWVLPGVDLAPEDDPVPGSSACLRMPHALFSGEHYVAIGNKGEPLVDRPRISIYFNVSAEGASMLMGLLSQALNTFKCRFTFKILNAPLAFGRYDAAKLEIQAKDYPFLCSVLEKHFFELRAYLSNPIPLFTCPLAPGIALVESPEDGTDFGLSRCELLAQALLNPQSSSHTRREMMEAQFVQHALDWSMPYLNPGSTARYHPLIGESVCHGLQGSHFIKS